MKEYKIRTHNNENLRTLAIELLTKLEYDGITRTGGLEYGLVNSREGNIHDYSESEFENDDGEEVTIYDLLDLIELQTKNKGGTQEITKIRKEMEVLAKRLEVLEG